MIRPKLFLAGALALMVTFAGTSAVAQEPTNQITFFTFSAPFELPGGKVLPAGTYVFKIVDSPSNRHGVQIMSEDQKAMHATLLAISSQRQDPAPEPEVRFMETAANTPPAIRTWWYPGRSIGHEFIYPREHARRLATRQSDQVLTVASDASTTKEMKTADLARVNASGRETVWTADTKVAEKAAHSSRQSTGRESTTPTAPTSSARTTTTPTSRAASTPANEPAPASEARTSLPQTASPLPLLALLGVGSLLGAGALRFRR